MQQGAAVLASNVSSVANQTGMEFIGGKAVVVVEATTYPTSLSLQTQGPSGKWVNCNSLAGTSAITADGIVVYDLPRGQYRAAMSGGTVAALYMVLTRIPY